MDQVADTITILGEPYDIPEPQESLQVRGPWPSGRKLVARRKLESVADFKLRIEAEAMVVAVRLSQRSPATSRLWHRVGACSNHGVHGVLCTGQGCGCCGGYRECILHVAECITGKPALDALKPGWEGR